VRWCGADHTPGAVRVRAQSATAAGLATRTRRNTVQRRIAHAADPQAPRSTEEAEPQGTPLAPEDQVNHIPVRRTAMVPPQGEPRGETQAAARKGAGRTRPRSLATYYDVTAL
jgi:hypothetical protein